MDLKSQEALQQEIEQLRKKLEQYEQAEAETWPKRIKLVGRAGGIIMGSRLKQSVDKLLGGDVSKDNLGDLIIAILYRLTRIGAFAILVAVIPIFLLFQQNRLLSRQNDKIDKQNFRLDQQTALSEAERRSAVILESGNVLDAVSRELAEKGNVKRTLSPPLIGRIIALSKAMKEYRYLDPATDSLIQSPMSPERGHLLLALQSADIDSSTMVEINTGAFFYLAELQDADLQFANLWGADLERADLRGAYLEGANLEGANLLKADLRGADLRGANLLGADLREADLREAKLLGANLKEAKFQGADLQGANLLKANLQGAELQGADLQGAILQEADLLGADLQLINLLGADLLKAKLLGANLKEAYLWRANLQGAYLWGADLEGANLQGANLQFADLQGANLQFADLEGANLQGANLLKADPWGAKATISQRDPFSHVMTPEQLESINWIED